MFKLYQIIKKQLMKKHLYYYIRINLFFFFVMLIDVVNVNLKANKFLSLTLKAFLNIRGITEKYILLYNPRLTS